MHEGHSLQGRFDIFDHFDLHDDGQTLGRIFRFCPSMSDHYTCLSMLQLYINCLFATVR